MASEKYIEQSTNLIKAIDIAIEVFKRTPPNGFNQQHVDDMVDSYNYFRKRVIEAEPKFQTLASLKYKVESVFERG